MALNYFFVLIFFVDDFDEEGDENFDEKGDENFDKRVDESFNEIVDFLEFEKK